MVVKPLKTSSLIRNAALSFCRRGSIEPGSIELAKTSVPPFTGWPAVAGAAAEVGAAPPAAEGGALGAAGAQATSRPSRAISKNLFMCTPSARRMTWRALGDGDQLVEVLPGLRPFAVLHLRQESQIGRASCWGRV